MIQPSRSDTGGHGPWYHGRNPCSSTRLGPLVWALVCDAARCVSVATPASATEVQPVGTSDGPASGSRATRHAGVIHRCADSQIEVEPEPDRECAAEGPTDPSRGCVDTRMLDQTALSDRPAHNSPRRCSETSGRVRGDGRAVDFFRRASDSMGLSSGRSATNRFKRLFSSSS